MAIPKFPNFIPVAFEHKDELLPFYATLKDGICENTFASLYLDSYKYRYNISRFSEKTYIVTGIENTEPKTLCEKLGLVCRFCYILGEFPSSEDFTKIFLDTHMKCCCYLKNVSKSTVEKNAKLFEEKKLHAEYDRDNADYLYKRVELAELKGKAFHKKKNLVNKFNAEYKGQTKQIDETTESDALYILNQWKRQRTEHAEDEGDFLQCSLAIQYRKELQLTGIILYADEKPAAFSLGEMIAGGTMYDTHFEKGIDSFHGVYQAVNEQMALSLPENVELINREQDLGDEGLRQAKLTYRPCGMVEKYKVCLWNNKTPLICKPDDMQV